MIQAYFPLCIVYVRVVHNLFILWGYSPISLLRKFHLKVQDSMWVGRPDSTDYVAEHLEKRRLFLDHVCLIQIGARRQIELRFIYSSKTLSYL